MEEVSLPPSVPPLTKDERNFGMFCHLSALAGYLVPVAGNIAGPLIVWLMKKDTMPFVDTEGKESLNFQISMTIYMIASGILTMLLCIFAPIVIALAIMDLVFVIIASMKAAEGKNYRYPLTIRFIQ